MFTETFPQNVKTQLDRRSLFNRGSLSQYQDFVTKIPFVFAYSNVRYPKKSLQNNLNNSILSSFSYDSGSNIINKQNFNDFYQLESGDFGSIPKPIIKSFSIQSVGNNSLYRKAKLQIQCFSPLQFLEVKRYFSVPASSIFFQFGNYNKTQINNILQPIKENSISNIDGTYLDYKTIIQKYNKTVNIDYFLGMISQVDIDQQGTKFKLNVTLLGQGQTQLLNYINVGRNDTYISKPLKKEYIVQLANKYTLDGQSILLTNTKQRYVTYNWITSLLLPLLRRSNDPRYYVPLVAFKPQFNFDVDLISSNPKVILCSDSFNIEGCKKVKLSSIGEIKSTYDKFKNILNELFKDDSNYDSKLIDQQYKILYNRFTDNGQFFWLGNVYISLQSIINLIFDQSLALSKFLQQIQDLVGKSLPVTVHNQPNQKLKIYTVTSNGLNNNLLSVYKIPNMGEKSIVRDLQYQIQLPSTYQKQVIAKNTQQCGKLIQQLFGDQFPVDIYQTNKNQWISSSSSKTIQQLNTQLDKFKTELTQIVKNAILNGNLSYKVINSQTYSKNIIRLMENILSIKNQIINIETKTRNLSSGYSIKVQLTLDFISGIQFGHLFKLQFNPLGWQSRFYVNEVRYNITPDSAKTTLLGFMIG